MDLDSLRADLENLRRGALERIAAASEPAQIDQLSVDLLGKKGELTLVLRGIGGLPAEQRPKVGAIANEVRQAIEGALAERGGELRTGALGRRLQAESVDVTTPGRPIPRGSRHPIIETMAELGIVGLVLVLRRRKTDTKDASTSFRVTGDGFEERVARNLKRFQISDGQLRLVVEHFFEMRHVPVTID